MRKDKRICKQPIIVDNIAFPCCKCGICRKQMSHSFKKALNRVMRSVTEAKFYECLF